MSPEAESNVHRVVKEEMDAALRPLYVILEHQSTTLKRQNDVMDKIADGAQAQILSANILHGNEALGLKGFVPETRENIAELQSWAANKDRVDDERWDETVKRVSALERNQNRFSRGCKKAFLMLLKKDQDGKRGHAKLGVATTVAGMLLSWGGHKLYEIAMHAWQSGGHVR